MSAEVLREAARLMRERAEAATPGPWFKDDQDSDCAHWVYTYSKEWGSDPLISDGHMPHNDGVHIASWHPAVALAVADWLEQMARGMAGTSYGDLPFEAAALAVARAYLGSDQ